MINEKGQFMKGHKSDNGFKKGSSGFTGKHSNESKEKMRLAKLGKNPPNKGKTKADYPNLANSGVKKGQKAWNKDKSNYWAIGEKNCNWKGGVSESTFSKKRKERLEKNGGSHTLAEWETLKAQYNWTCPCCKRQEPEINLTEDHIIPVCKGGSDNIENIQPLCKQCNSRKYTNIIKY